MYGRKVFSDYLVNNAMLNHVSSVGVNIVNTSFNVKLWKVP